MAFVETGWWAVACRGCCLFEDIAGGIAVDISVGTADDVVASCWVLKIDVDCNVDVVVANG